MKIISPWNKKEFLESYEIRWELHIQKTRRRIQGMIIATVVVYLIAVAGIYEDGEINPFVYLGTFFLIGTIISGLANYFQKRSTFSKINEIANEFEEKQMDCEYQFSNESVKYKDKEKEIDLKWDVFTNYTTYKDYFIFIIKDSFWQSYYFKQTEEDEDFEKIKALTKEKLEYKKVK